MPKKAKKSKYTTNDLAKGAMNQFTSSLTDREGNRMAINDLDSYVTDNQLRRDYENFYDYDQNLARYNAQSDASWDLARAEQIQAMNKAESQNYANTQNAVAQMRNALAGSAAGRANRGAANATALQALLGLGQQNSAATTEGMQGYQNAAREAAAARAANGVSAFDSAREGMNSMYESGTSAYNADHLYGTQGVAESVGSMGSAFDTNAASERMNNTTNQTNLDVANTHTKQTIYNKK